jgi:hypothetical protein
MSWNESNYGLTNTNVNSLLVSNDVIGGTNLFAGTNSGLFRSTDNGTSWNSAGLTGRTIYSLATIGTNLFAGTSGSGIFLSTDNGSTWTAVNSGLTWKTVTCLAASGTNLFAGGKGVFLSTNNGTSWTAVNNGLTANEINALAVSPNGTGGINLLAGTTYYGVFLSTDNGTSWAPVNSGLTSSVVYSFAVSPKRAGGANLFAGTNGGVFLSTNDGTSWINVNTDIIGDCSVYSLLIGGMNVLAGTDYGLWIRTLSEMLPNHPPVADAGSNQNVEATGPTGAQVTLTGSASDPDGDILTYTWKEGEITLGISATLVTTLPLGTHTITLIVQDSGGLIASDEVIVKIEDTTSPTIALNGDSIVVIEQGSSYIEQGVLVSDIVDPSPIITISGQVDSSNIGEYTLEYTATDFSGNSAKCSRVVQVVKTPSAKPTIIVSSRPTVLWPPFHQYEKIDVKDIVKRVYNSKNCPMPECAVNIYSASSDEPEDAIGNGDGRTSNDIVILPERHCKHFRHMHKEKSVMLRAERDINGNGRVYTITLVVEDEYNAVGTATYEVWVPIDRSNKNVVNDGPCYTVYSAIASKYALGKSSMELADEIPQSFKLFDNYPNPFNPSTEIQFGIKEESFVILTVYDMIGRMITTLAQENLQPGIYTTTFNAQGLSSGIYIYRLQAGSYVETKRMVLMK